MFPSIVINHNAWSVAQKMNCYFRQLFSESLEKIRHNEKTAAQVFLRSGYLFLFHKKLIV